MNISPLQVDEDYNKNLSRRFSPDGPGIALKLPNFFENMKYESLTKLWFSAKRVCRLKSSIFA